MATRHEEVEEVEEVEEELRRIAARVPKSLKKRLQRAAVDDDSSSQAIITSVR